MNSKRQLQQLHRQVRRDRAAIGDRAATWSLPLSALAAGLFMPVLTRTSSANPLTQLAALLRQAVGRFFSFIFYRNLYAILHRSGLVESLSVDDTR